jgi:hypothetical protein
MRTANFIVSWCIIIALCISQGCLEWFIREPAALRKEPVGTLATAYLQGNVYKQLVIEVDWVDGAPPYQDPVGANDPLEILESRIRSYCNKSDIEVFVAADILPICSMESTYTLSTISKLEDDNRQYYRSNDIAVIYIIYLNGTFSDDENKLGIAYSASSIAIFKSQILAITDTILATATNEAVRTIESAVLIHELGHLLGLVNLIYDSKFEHEAVTHVGPADCNTTGNQNLPACVMYPTIDHTAVIEIYKRTGTVVTDFCSYCKADLEALRYGYTELCD